LPGGRPDCCADSLTAVAHASASPSRNIEASSAARGERLGLLLDRRRRGSHGPRRPDLTRGAGRQRSYWAAYGPDAPAAGREPLPPPPIPVGFTAFPGEIWKTPRSWVEASYPNVIYFNEVDKGGHFAAWEEPELFATEMRAAFRSLR